MDRWTSLHGCSSPSSTLWDWSLTWESDWPDLTPCFHRAVAPWLPVAAAVFLLTPFVKSKETGKRRRRTGRLHRMRTALVFCLSVVQVFEVMLTAFSSSFTSSHLLSACIRLSSSLLASFAIHRRGGGGSAAHFLFWLTSASCLGVGANSAVAFGRRRGWERPQTILLPLEFSLAVASWVLSFLADGSKVYRRGEEEEEELKSVSSFASHFSFSWFTPTVLTGWGRPLQFEDMVVFDKDDRAPKIRASWESAWRKLYPGGSSQRKVNIWWAIAKNFGGTYVLATMIDIVIMTIQQVVPRLQGLLIVHAEDQSAEQAWKGYLYAVAIFLSLVLQFAFTAKVTFMLLGMGTRIKASLMMAIYGKVLRLSSSARKEFTDGEIINFMSVDAAQFNMLSYSINTLFNASFIIGCSLWSLHGYLGPSCLAGLIVIILTIPVNSIITRRIKRHKEEAMRLKDLRVKVTSEVMDGIRVVKFNAWEEPFSDKINGIREEELKHSKSIALLSAVHSLFFQSTPFLIAFATFATYVCYFEGALDAEKVFVSISYFNMIRYPMEWLPNFFSQMTQAWVSIGRMNRFLGAREVGGKQDATESPQNAVEISDAEFSWNGSSASSRLSMKELTIRKGEFVGVVGQVGDGKSSLLSSLLGEMEQVGGNVRLSGSIAYLPAQAFIRNASLKDNILFGNAYEQVWYDRVVEACDLLPDLEVLEGGDLAEIGEKGVNLSGGQKQRVGLARAIYSQRDIYLLDDPLSAVDAHVANHIFEKCLDPKEGMLRGKTVLLVTNSTTFLPKVDKVVLLKDGVLEAVNDYEMLKNEYPFLHMSNINDIVDHHPINRQTKKKQNRIKKNHIKAERHQHHDDEDHRGKLVEEEKIMTDSVSGDVYAYYFRSIGLPLAVTSILLHLVNQVFLVGTNLWLAEWASDVDEGSDSSSTNNFYLLVYAGLGAAASLSFVCAALLVSLGGVSAASTIHGGALAGVLRSPVHFFEANPLGRIINRFSSDVNWMDATLPDMYNLAFEAAFELVCTGFVVCLTNTAFVLVLLPICLWGGFLQRIFVKLSRQIKRINSVKKSPLFSHLGETLSGISTIRAFDATERFAKENVDLVDVATTGYFNNCYANHWVRVRMEFATCLVTLVASLFAVAGRGGLSPGMVGLSISYALEMSKAPRSLFRALAQIEARMVCVERLWEYQRLPGEEEEKVDRTVGENVSDNWPSHGSVAFTSFQARYREDLEPALKEVSFNVRPGEKLGVLGRTGAGKSSLALALFRMLRQTSGAIEVDGRDVHRIPLQILRSRMSIIPQDPVLFSGTVHFNVDPFGRYSAGEVAKVLRKSHLERYAADNNGTFQVGEKGSNLSSGQRQLVCLARALLRDSKLLVLDEATAAVDLETDSLVQQTIRREFAGSTVITIAHRLDTIMDSDRVLVMEGGRVAEIGSPDELRKDQGSIFASMIRSADD